MRHADHRYSARAPLLILVILALYLAAFNFNIERAYTFAFSGTSELLHDLFQAW